MKHEQSRGVCFRHCRACAEKADKATLKRQRLAMSAYDCGCDPKKLTEHSVNHDGDLDGDCIAMHIWCEVGESASKLDAANRINNTIEELRAVARKLLSAAAKEVVV